ncbi:MAG: threonine synthase [Spirochaetaceae bacterium 4572_59]|nr:MAG: threonine synthase [Spirochaetaceae bacterium 4572_59]
MVFASTRNKELKMSFQKALFQGLSPDGGLFYPCKMPDMTDIIKSFSENENFKNVASSVIYHLLNEDMSETDSKILAERAFPFSPKLKKINDKLHVLELYHGPSSAFKDFGASFLATSMEYFLQSNDKKAVILTATSGDTGSAVARAFYEKKNIDVVILYPKGRISPLQEKQMTTLGKNIHALEVEGSFDDCQKMVKDAFTDPELKNINLSSANSINLGRLIPQSLYYFWAVNQLKKIPEEQQVFCVPSGNFGNLTAGLYAKYWGLSIRKFIASTNQNDVIPEFLKTSVYTPRPSIQTYSNAMDVGSPSNFERMQTLYQNDVESMRKDVRGICIDDDSTLETIRKYNNEFNYEICPHTAVGLKAAEIYAQKHPFDHITVLSTAHPGKFLEVFNKAVGHDPELPLSLLELKDKTKVSEVIGNTLTDLKTILNKMYR